MIARVTAPTTEFLYLDQEDVVAAGGTDMPAMVDVLERAFRIKGAGQVRMPPKVTITWSDEPATEELHGRIMAMPGYVGGEAVMDGTVVSAMRTGAVTGVAVRHLAAPGAAVACLLGAGVLAHTQLAALRTELPALREVRVYDPLEDRCRRFCERQAADGLALRPAASAEQAVRGAQVVVPATMAVGPTFEPVWLEPGATVVLVSSLDGPLELHAACDLLVVDDWMHESTHAGRYGQRLVEAGIVPADGSAAVELADVVTGRHPGREDAGERIVVSPVGLAMDDLAAAAHVLEGARARGLGTSLRLRTGAPVWE
jgi:N-[(2S)-2-amino-2-carboxyethyl]-L-glutamate dehydrogenase